MDQVKIGGLWKKKDKNSKSYLLGSLNQTVNIMIFPNKYKENDNHPDYLMYLSTKDRKNNNSNYREEEDDL